jgi:anti-sigma regulatory factor (Ser/Thr protein kinase)
MAERFPMDDVDLVVTEAFANAVKHADNAGAAVTVGVEVRGSALRLEVTDRDPRPCPPVRTAAPLDLDDGGRGLLIVESLAQRWGVLPRPDGKVVFMEFAPNARADGEPG